MINDKWEILFKVRSSGLCLSSILYKLGLLGLPISATSFSWVKLDFYVSLLYFLNRDCEACTRQDSRDVKMNKTQFLTSRIMVEKTEIKTCNFF